MKKQKEEDIEDFTKILSQVNYDNNITNPKEKNLIIYYNFKYYEKIGNQIVNLEKLKLYLIGIIFIY